MLDSNKHWVIVETSGNLRYGPFCHLTRPDTIDNLEARNIKEIFIQWHWSWNYKNWICFSILMSPIILTVDTTVSIMLGHVVLMARLE